MTGLEAVDAAKGRRDTDGASAIDADGDRNEASSHRVRRTARGASSVVVWIVGVPGRAVIDVVVCSV